MTLGPRNEAEKLIYAEERFIVEIQYVIKSVMHEKKITNRQLSQLTGIDEGHISRILTTGHNTTIRTLAQMFYSLSDEPIFTSAAYEKLVKEKGYADMKGFIK